ncbi:hypothetical protein OSTOST_23533, partial [Ostertagia ostertagi]
MYNVKMAKHSQGAFLVAEIEGKFGKFNLRTLPNDFMSELFSIIQLYGELVTSAVKPKTADLQVFLSDYMCKYHGNKDWKIQEISLGNAVDVNDSILPCTSMEMFSSRMDVDAPPDVEFLEDKCDEELFNCSKHESNGASSMTFSSHQEYSNVTEHLQASPCHSS